MRKGPNTWTAIAVAVSLGLLVAGGSLALGHKADTAAADAAFVKAEAWAFPEPRSPDPSVPKGAPEPKPDMHAPMHVPGSTRTYTRAELRTGFDVADWFPQDHPPMPHVVQYGRKPAYACGSCHMPDGAGVPSTASLAGSPAAYLREQLQAFRDGQRSNDIMPFEARHLDAADERAAVRYFSMLKFESHEKVVETTRVPKTHWNIFVLRANHDGASEPLGERIIEVGPNDGGPDSERVVYTAFVPPGSIEAGATIAAKGTGVAPACESCHGARLQGVGDIPYLAGRSPTYIVRELILFRLGKRTNSGAAAMRAEVSHLTLRDMIDVAAYAASRKP